MDLKLPIADVSDGGTMHSLLNSGLDEKMAAFCNAFLTEIGDLDQLISERELFDVIVCAGRDVSMEEVHQLCETIGDSGHISYEDAASIFRKVPPTDYDALRTSLDALTVDGVINYELLLNHVQAEVVQNPLGLDEEGDEIVQWLRDKRAEGASAKKLIEEMRLCQAQLIGANARIVLGRHHEDSKEAKPNLPKSSGESLSSMFSSRNTVTADAFGMGGDAMSVTQKESTATAVTPRNADNGTAVRSEGTVRLKSMVVQNSGGQSTCIAYSFRLERMQRVRVAVHVNEKVDPSLNRFHNSILGLIVRSPGPNVATPIKIMGLTKRKDADGAMATDWLHLANGFYTVHLKFCRALRMCEPEKSDEIVDARGKLTKPFKVMLMNLFDIFDLDDDGLLSRTEFESYSILSGSGKVSDEEWGRIGNDFPLRDGHITMPTFVEMHQREAATYGDNSAQLKDMWMAVRELGHNRKFYLSTACPLHVDFRFSDKAPRIDGFEIIQTCAEGFMERALLCYFWDNGTPLPYLKEVNSLRQFKTDYYSVLVAGYSDHLMHYKLDLSASISVNIEGHDLIIDKIVQPNTMKILTVAIAVGTDSWFLNVRKSVK